MDRFHRYGGAFLLVLAALVHAGAMLGVARARGSATAYAYQSPDSAEYVGLGRGLAWQARYVRLDPAGQQQGGPDTWRTPGFPLVLAGVIRLFGDSTAVLLAFNQVLSVATVPLLWLLLRRYCGPGWALLGGLGWCLDPFRVYYSLWIMAETLFTLVLLAGCLLWERGSRGGWTPGRSLGLGAISGALVLIRPIGMLLPVVACIGIAVQALRRGGRHRERDAGGPLEPPQAPRLGRLQSVTLCVLGVTVVLGPWLVRGRAISGHWAISDQSGASFAYHKVVDVVLWSEGRQAQRFDSDAVASVRERIDQRLRELWAARHGPLTPAERDALRWERLNFGEAAGIDRVEASSLLWEAGVEQLRGRWWALVRCFTAQGVSMLVFPLALVIAPPAGEASSPLSMLGGGGAAGRLAALAIGLAYVVLAIGSTSRLMMASVRRRWSPAFFAAVPALVLFVLSLPSEDPRFRLPLVPLLWLLMLADARPRPGAARNSSALPTGPNSPDAPSDRSACTGGARS